MKIHLLDLCEIRGEMVLFGRDENGLLCVVKVPKEFVCHEIVFAKRMMEHEDILMEKLAKHIAPDVIVSHSLVKEYTFYGHQETSFYKLLFSCWGAVEKAIGFLQSRCDGQFDVVGYAEESFLMQRGFGCFDWIDTDTMTKCPEMFLETKWTELDFTQVKHDEATTVWNFTGNHAGNKETRTWNSQAELHAYLKEVDADLVFFDKNKGWVRSTFGSIIFFNLTRPQMTGAPGRCGSKVAGRLFIDKNGFDKKGFEGMEMLGAMCRALKTRASSYLLKGSTPGLDLLVLSVAKTMKLHLHSDRYANVVLVRFLNGFLKGFLNGFLNGFYQS